MSNSKGADSQQIDLFEVANKIDKNKKIQKESKIVPEGKENEAVGPETHYGACVECGNVKRINSDDICISCQIKLEKENQN